MAFTQRMAGSEPRVRELIDGGQPFGNVGHADQYEIAGLMPLPADRMWQRAVRLQQEAGRVWDTLTGKGRSKAARLRERAALIEQARTDWDPLRSQDRELENRFRGLEGTARSRPEVPRGEAERLVRYGEDQLRGQKVNPWAINGGAGFPDDVKQQVFRQYDIIMKRNHGDSPRPLAPNVVPALTSGYFGEADREYRDRWNMQFDPPDVKESRRRRLAEMEEEIRGGKRTGLSTGAGGAYTQGGSWLDGERLDPRQRERLRSGNMSPSPLIVPGVGHQFEGI